MIYLNVVLAFLCWCAVKNLLTHSPLLRLSLETVGDVDAEVKDELEPVDGVDRVSCVGISIGGMHRCWSWQSNLCSCAVKNLLAHSLFTVLQLIHKLHMSSHWLASFIAFCYRYSLFSSSTVSFVWPSCTVDKLVSSILKVSQVWAALSSRFLIVIQKVNVLAVSWMCPCHCSWFLFNPRVQWYCCNVI